MHGRRSAMALFTIGAIGLTACGGGDSGGGGPIEPGEPTITVTPAALEMLTGNTVQLTAQLTDPSGTPDASLVTWASDNPAIATVSESGLVTGTGPGIALIRVEYKTAATIVRTEVIESLNLQAVMDGVMEEDFYLINYFDLDSSNGIQDYNCGPKSYDGHRGVDIGLRSFAHMDSLVAIIAPAPGQVVFTDDGHFDRNKTWDNGGGFANHVVLEHSNGMRTYYGHMMQNSVAVQVGDQVAVGDTLGYVGSSGTSNIPHLHFEVRDADGAFPPYSGTCSSPISMWAEQEPYRDQFQMIEGDLTLSQMNLDLAKERPPATRTVQLGTGQRLYAWVEYVNQRPGVRTDFRLVAPNDQIVNIIEIQAPQYFSLAWWWAWWTPDLLGALPGTWSVEIWQSAEMLAKFPVEFLPRQQGVTPQAAEGPTTGSGGAGLNSPHGDVRLHD
jgi:murein DD-endopeptidase MepM/ murein hydrolase activator NlpD